jgi:hypothetical protein
VARSAGIARLLVGGALLVLGCASTSPKLELLRTQYLESRRGELKGDLDPRLQDLGFLVGVSGATVQSALGPPERCRDPRSLEVRLLPQEECLRYTFELAGFGPAYGLQLWLDRRGSCVEPRWLILAL